MQSSFGGYAPATSSAVTKGESVIDRWVVDSEPSTRYPIFTRGNVGEVFPDPVAPLSGDLITLHSESGLRDAFACFGSNDHAEFNPYSNVIIGMLRGYC